MASRTATVARVNHDDDTIDAWDVDTGEITGVPFDGFPPAPLSTVLLTDGPAWRVDRQIGPVRQLFYDDFTEGQERLLEYAERTSSSGNVATETADINVTHFLRAGQRYKVELTYKWDGTASNTGVRVRLRDGAGIAGTQFADSTMLTGFTSVPESNRLVGYVVGDDATHTITVTIDRVIAGSVQFIAASTYPTFVALYEDDPTAAGDTAWRIISALQPEPTEIGTGGKNHVSPASVDDALGAIELEVDNTSQNYIGISKATEGLIVPPSDRGLWFGARVRMPSSGVGTIVAGFRNNTVLTSDRDALAQFDDVALGAIQLQTEGSGTTDSANTGTNPATSTWYIVDIVLIAGLYAALWIDGDGPWIVDDPDALPAEGDGIHPLIYLANNESAAGSMFVDWCQVQQFSQANAPTAFAVSGVPPVG